ncbi:MAG: putative lipid II flippase FtsW [Actinobacteria bacterium]|nr:putative lipid II flippase FtsW [Actinomycetota bacterium]
MNETNLGRYNIFRVNIEYYFIFIITFLLSVIGIIMISSASIAVGERYFSDPYWFVRRQIIWWVISLILFIIFSKINYHFYSKISIFFILIAIGLLAIVLIPSFSIEIGGSRRWLNLLFFNIQPSEVAKLAVIIFLCDTLNKKYRKRSSIKNILFPAFVVLVIVTVLIFLEPDLSTVIIIWAVAFTVLFVGNVKFQHIFSLGIIGIAVIVGYMMMEEYRRERIFAFIDKTTGGTGVNFQVNQSLIALGSGSITGVGLGNSVQKYSYLPEAHTDFIFAILGEEFGLVGTTIVLLLFFLFTLFGIRVCLKTEEFFGRILAAGMTALIAIQVIINVAVVIGLLPVTGLTLPFISFGGSSLLICMVSVGILLNISRQNITVVKNNTREA